MTNAPQYPDPAVEAVGAEMGDNPIMWALNKALERLSAAHIPPPEEEAHLEAALAHLIAAFDTRDFEPGEEAVWNCGSITIAGKHRGAWEIKLRQTDCDSGSHPEGENSVAG
jgi:hypothetical protein